MDSKASKLRKLGVRKSSDVRGTLKDDVPLFVRGLPKTPTGKATTQAGPTVSSPHTGPSLPDIVTGFVAGMAMLAELARIAVRHSSKRKERGNGGN